MRKDLIVFNGVSYPTHVIAFARKLGKDRRSLLHAVFTKPKHVEDSLQYPFPNDLSSTTGSVEEADEERTDMQAIEDNKQVFKDECQLDNINYIIDDEPEILLDDLIEHSKFSDLMIADVNDDLGKYSIEELLKKTLCPIILVQRQSDMPQRVILAYDGSASSIQAMKMYSYLFPEWRKLHTVLVQVNPADPGKVSKHEHLEDWLGQHFENLQISILEGDIEDEFSALLHNDSEKTMVVMGAFGNKGLRGLFHESLANKIVGVSHVSLFISHL